MFKKLAVFIFSLVILLFLASCFSYKKTPQLHYYRGPNVPAEFINIVRATPDEIEFVLRVKFPEKKLYHLILDGDQPVAEGWYSTVRADGNSYNLVMKIKPGLTFETGKTYRLCIGQQSPEYVQLESNNYQCIAEYVFVFEEK
ncbi:MAG: hypothetical protein QME85_07035 [Candidatus Saccharicenans sp.]|nr:hypothetical protein [Candidatus Saccharicenans sp.]MDI6848774.1 hypothetical protein [Candidatus Saccharicenans sp.]